MKSVVLAIVSAAIAITTTFVACTGDVETYDIIPQSNAPTLGQAHQQPIPTAPDAAECGSACDTTRLDAGLPFDSGVPMGGFDAGGSLNDAE